MSKHFSDKLVDGMGNKAAKKNLDSSCDSSRNLSDSDGCFVFHKGYMGKCKGGFGGKNVKCCIILLSGYGQR